MKPSSSPITHLRRFPSVTTTLCGRDIDTSSLDVVRESQAKYYKTCDACSKASLNDDDDDDVDKSNLDTNILEYLNKLGVCRIQLADGRDIEIDQSAHLCASLLAFVRDDKRPVRLKRY